VNQTVELAAGPVFENAACRRPGVDPRWFFDARRVDRARAVCAGCPELDACRTHALADPYLTGVWGGLTEAERDRERRPNLARVTDLVLEQPPVNGHTPSAGPVAASARTCQGCGASLVGKSPRALWCSPQCRRRHYDARRPRKAPRTPPVAATAPQTANVIDAPITDRLTAVVADLCAAGLAVTLELDGAVLTVRG